MLLKRLIGHFLSKHVSRIFSEAELTKMAFQHVVLMTSNKKLQTRIFFSSMGGISRLLIHLFKLTLSTMRNRRLIKACDNLNCEFLCITASDNQARNSFEFFQNYKEVKTLHFAGGKYYDGGSNLMGLEIREWALYLPFLVRSLIRHRREISQIFEKYNNKCLDYICDIFFVIFYFELKNISPKEVVINTDLSAFGNTVGYLFKEKGSKVIYLPHSPPLKYDCPVYYDQVICRSKKEVDTRTKKNWTYENNNSLSFKLVPHDLKIGSDVGILLKPEDNLAEVRLLLEDLKGNFVLRPHPMIGSMAQYKDLAREFDIQFSNPKLQSGREFLSSVKTVIGRLSGLHREIIDLGGEAIVLKEFNSEDNYGLLECDGVATVSDWSEIKKLKL